MSRKGFFTDTSLCIGCKACEVACKEWNQIPASPQGFTGHSYDNTIDLGANTWRHVAFVEQPKEGKVTAPGNGIGTYQDGDSLRWLMASDVCKHCEHAACLEVCPTGALFRTEFDTVVVQEDVCNGCGYCVPACPFGVLDQREDDGRVWKCERNSAVAKYEFAVAQGTDAVEPLSYAIQTIDIAIADRVDRKNRLTLRATAEGQLIAPELHEMIGRFVQGGQEVAMVAKPDHLTVHVLAEQKDVQPIVHGLDGMRNVVTEIRFAGDVLHTYKGGHPQEYGMAQEEARSASLTSLAGTTDVPTDPKDPKKFLIPQFDIGVPLENPDNRYVIGQRAYVRFTLDKKPLVWQWTRRFWQLIQTKSSSSPWI